MRGVLTIIIALIFIFFFLTRCEKYEEDSNFPSTEFIAVGAYQGEYWPTREWRTCAPEEVGMDPKKLRELNEEIILLLEMHVDIHSVLIVKDGYIIAEQYYSEDYSADSLHHIASCTKSITSALLGIAMEKGFLQNVDQHMIDFFPEYEVQNLSEAKESITLEHMLTMSAGLEWYEMEYPYGDDRNTYRQWINQGGGVQFVLDRPMIAVPGEEYSYNTGASHVLSGILQKVTGARTDSFALEYLFTPIGIDNYYWPVDGGGIAYGGSSMRLTPRDMARFGYLYLKNGIWDGARIIPENWVEQSQQKHIARKYIEDYYYGYHWWVSDKNSFSAMGYGGQWITVIPEHNLVVVFTNSFEEGEALQLYTPERLIDTYILPAIE
ncbi:MAG: serine hydrolase [Bacteroidota bacterium]